MSASGRWFEPFGDFEPVRVAACPGYVAAAGSAEDGFEVRVAKWDGDLVERHRIGLPGEVEEDVTDAWMSFDAGGSDVSLAIAFANDFAWCGGVMVVPRLGQDAYEYLGTHPEEDDFDFGAPLLLRGDELFLRSPMTLFGALRREGDWEVEELADDEFDVEEWWWSLALTSDGTRLAAACISEDGGGAVVVFARDDASSPFHVEATVQVDDNAVDLHFLPDGRLVAALPGEVRIYERSGESWTESSVFSPPSGGAIQGMAGFGSHLVVAQLEHAWALEPTKGAWVHLAEAERAKVTMMGEHPVVQVGRKFGVFELGD